MTWVKVDDRLFLNPKFRDASDEARLMFFAGLTYAAQGETDGRIADADLPIVAAYARQTDATKIAGELVRLRLWETVDGGYQIHDFLDYNPSRASLEAERKRKREWAANSRSGANSASTRPSGSETPDGLVAASRSRSPSRSGSPSRSLTGVGAPSEPSLLDFATRGKVKTWALTASHVAELREAFPDLDIIAQARKAKAWLAANPTRGKTATGMATFLYSWLAREQNGGRGWSARPSGLQPGWRDEKAPWEQGSPRRREPLAVQPKTSAVERGYPPAPTDGAGAVGDLVADLAARKAAS